MFRNAIFDVRRFVRNLKNPRAVDISALTSAYKNSKIALDIALDYSSTRWHGDLFRDIVAEFKYNQAGTFGIYRPKEDFVSRAELIELVVKEKEVARENIYGVSFGINIEAILNFWKSNFDRLYGPLKEDPNFQKIADKILHYYIILEIATTMVHEARHALLKEKNGILTPGSEAEAQKTEKDFLRWFLIPSRKLQLMKDLGIPNEYIKLIIDPVK